MPIRITGMNSGLDTESIITELVKAQKTKTESVRKKQTTLEWKQDAWKELNSKIFKLFNGTLANMRFDGYYTKKTTDVSNASIASIVTGDSAMNATQSLEVEKLATAGYMTGAEVAGDVTKSSKLTDIGVDEGTTITVTLGNGESKDIEVTSDMTVGGFVDALKSAGVEASFDEKNKRFHIAAKETGEANDFSITSSDADALDILGLAVDDDDPNTEVDPTKAQKTKGNDASIVLNGVRYTGSSNTFEVNGLTITALQESEEKVTLTTRQDTDGIYDKIKNFFKEYNSLINEMDKLYNAESSKGYEPLTDDEKAEMSDSEIEKWEKKIKDSVLRRDSNLSTVASTMKSIMLQGATVNGKQMYLSQFGIETLGYYSAKENERNAYHINGDEDDSAVSSKENELKAAIATDPETVTAFFTQLSQNLYTELNKQSSSVEGIRTFGTFYDDKKMKEDYDDYTTKIKEQEAKLTALQDRWYSKFSAMETALARMQSSQSAISGLFGG